MTVQDPDLAARTEELMRATQEPWRTAIPYRLMPRGSTSPWKRMVPFGIIFNVACLLIVATQLLVWPFILVDHHLYEMGIRFTKNAFGVLMVLMCQWFAPTKFIITTEGMDESVVVRDAAGKPTGLKLPEKLVLMANHQVYLDWWYLWAFTYFTGSHANVLIMLKKSLKWVPIVGWGMQFYEFIFMARSWGEDRAVLDKHLRTIGERAQRRDEPIALMVFPEGTLVSKLTRPVSKKYADKMGLDDMTNMLLPRSTGLLYCLRSLSPNVPSLHLLDITVGYPGIPHAGYGQSYYTLRSVFFQGVPPPAVHLHLRMYHVQRDIPVGNLSLGGSDATSVDKDIFDTWLRDRWREKDRLLDAFYQDGRFYSGKKIPAESSATGLTTNGETTSHSLEGGDSVVIPLEVRSKWDILYGFCWFAPILAGLFFVRTKNILF